MAYATITKPSLHFNTKLYTGNGGTQSITGVGFQPDWIWGKNRDDTNWHNLYDAVRGVNKAIISNENSAESTRATGLSAFGTDGFTTGADGNLNGNGDNYVAWNWKANGAGSSNSDGTITSTVSANTTAGFSIATWTGTGSNGSVGHGLGGVDCMIIKDLSNTRDWYFWNKTMAYNTRLELNNTEVFTTGTDNMTALPDSTKINMATSTQNNGSGNNYVGYFFQEKAGYSKFGSYTGNGNANGAFIYTGFKPAWVIIKPTTVAQNWQIHDTKRDGYNPNNDNLSSNNSNAEADNKFIDIVSNGFKLRRSDVLNVSGDPYIYMAFAEEPLVANVGNSIPATAR